MWMDVSSGLDAFRLDIRPCKVSNDLINALYLIPHPVQMKTTEHIPILNMFPHKSFDLDERTMYRIGEI